jgi:hypothetical protein
MSRILEIAGNVFLLLIVLGFGVWLLIRALKRSEDPPKLIFKSALTAVVIICMAKVAGPMLENGGYSGAFVGVPLAAVCGLVLAIIWRHSVIDIIAKPFGSLYDGGDEPPEPKPAYSTALSKRKLNKPLEAVVEIRRQLALFPDDYEGVMLLAGILAEDLKDLPAAETTLNHFCDRPDAPPKQVAAALTQLADWHLIFFQDADSARVALEKIITQFPEGNYRQCYPNPKNRCLLRFEIPSCPRRQLTLPSGSPGLSAIALPPVCSHHHQAKQPLELPT